MNPSRERFLALLLLLAVLVVNAAALWPEIAISRVDLNDNVFHFTLVERMVEAVQRGENPLDCWSPEWSFGYPVLRLYQPLAHGIVALLYFALGKSAGLMTIFVWVRFLSVALLPLSFFAAARRMGLAPLTAAASALLAPLISTNFLYGVEYGSYTWAGSGLFPQAVASNLLLLTLGFGFRAIRRGEQMVLTGVLLGLTFLAHLIYGYMGALSICLILAIPDADRTRWVGLRRTLVVGSVAFLLSGFQLLPLFTDRSTINHSRWEPVWKWDSFGGDRAVKWLFTGELLDHGRLPVLNVLAFSGAALILWAIGKRRPVFQVHSYVLLGATFWTLMFFGRPFWGPLLTMLGVSSEMQLHRVIGGAQIFLVFLAAIALAAAWTELSRRGWYAAAIIATALLLFQPVQERARYLSNNATWGRRNLAAHEEAQPSLSSTIAEARERGGRVYAGLAAAWGGKFKIGDVQFYAFLSEANVPAVAFLYHSMALTSDIMVRFNEWNPAHYQLFNIRTVIAPDTPESPLPAFLLPIGQFGRFKIYKAPGSSYFDVVDVLASIKTTKENFYDINDQWLQSDWVVKREHLWLDWTGEAPQQFPRLAPDQRLPQMPALPSIGKVSNEQRNGEVYQADVEAVRPGFLLFKMTWHPNWKAYIDGSKAETIMLSPGFAGVRLMPGNHHVLFQYAPKSRKPLWAIAGLLAVLLMFVSERRGLLDRAVEWRIPIAIRRPLIVIAGLLLLALPVCIPLFTGAVLWGHDGFVYFPRLVEVHENITHGILLPRWAPDLGRGTGQPLFLFHPPMIYYLGEFWHLLGFDFVAAMNLTCVVIVLASAGSMFLLARLYFGDAGGWLAAAAYLYAPYFAVDLYVRSAMEEFAAFPFFALALYGFGAFAIRRKPRYWLTGVLSYVCLMSSHFPAALLFTPLLVAFLGFTAWQEKSWRILWMQAGSFLLALGISAFIWAPALWARQYASMNRAVEGNGKYSNHLVYLHQLFYSPWGYGLSVPGPDDGMSFAVGWSHLLLAAAVWIWMSRTKPIDLSLVRFFAIAALVLCVLMLQDAIWIWEQVPLLQNVQLPWRLLGPVTLCVAMLIAPLGRLLASVPRWQTVGTAAAMSLLIVPNLSHLHPRQFVDVDLRFWTPQQLSIRGFETTTMAEIQPRWIRGLPPYLPVAATVLSGDAEIESPGRTEFSWSSLVKVRRTSVIEMNTAWFPGWQVRIDGGDAPAGPGPQSGLITFAVSPGEHTVQVQYARTPTEKAAGGISIAALVVTILVALYVALYSGRSQRNIAG